MFLGGIESGKRFAGGPNIEGKGWVPNITQKGLADYSENDIAYLLETGQTPDGDSVGGAMTAVIRNTSQLPAADREAMAVYLKSLPPRERSAATAKEVARAAAGLQNRQTGNLDTSLTRSPHFPPPRPLLPC